MPNAVLTLSCATLAVCMEGQGGHSAWKYLLKEEMQTPCISHTLKSLTELNV